MRNIAIFASGSGTNAENIIRYFNFGSSKVARVVSVLSNKPDACVLQRAQNLNVDIFVFNKNSFYETAEILDYLKEKKIDFVVLAGFLWKVPDFLIEAFRGKILNIHPALLPKFGGKGMYGMNVHKAVKAAGESETGITIHHVNEQYDSGDIIFQAKCFVSPSDTAEDIAAKIHELEQAHFPKTLETLIGKCQ